MGRNMNTVPQVFKTTAGEIMELGFTAHETKALMDRSFLKNAVPNRFKTCAVVGGDHHTLQTGLGAGPDSPVCP